MKKTKTKTPPKPPSRRGWPKGKPRKPKGEFLVDLADPTTTDSTARTIHVAGPIRAIPHRLGAEWQFMDLDEWRRNPTCVEYLQKLRDDPMFRRFLGMLHSYASRNGVEAPQTETSASITLGKIQGRREILEVIDEAAIASVQIVNPADFPTFADEGEPMGII